MTKTLITIEVEHRATLNEVEREKLTNDIDEAVAVMADKEGWRFDDIRVVEVEED